MSGPDAGDRLAPSAQNLARWHAAMRRLPDAEREAFLFWRMDDLTYLQIAENMGLSIAEVEVLLGRALAQLTRELYPRESDPDEGVAASDQRPGFGARLRRIVGAGLQHLRRWWRG